MFSMINSKIWVIRVQVITTRENRLTFTLLSTVSTDVIIMTLTLIVRLTFAVDAIKCYFLGM